MKVAWFSCGATSAITCYLALKEDNKTELVYIETGSHHEDCKRFLMDCEEKLFKKKIKILQSKYKNIFDVFERTNMIRTPKYAPCTELLKRREELAEFLGDSSLCRICLYSHNENCLHETCKQGVLQWLNQEIEE